MSLPDFTRAEYIQPQTIETGLAGEPILPRGSAPAFPLAVLFGAAAAVVGSIGYAMVASVGIMFSIVAIGIAWLIVKAMMTASSGVGGRSYQIVAVTLTYFAVSWGDLLHPLWNAHLRGAPWALWWTPMVLKYALLGPILELSGSPFNGLLGLVILFIGLRTAWRMAAGSPGFGDSGRGRRPRIDPLGIR